MSMSVGAGNGLERMSVRSTINDEVGPGGQQGALDAGLRDEGVGHGEKARAAHQRLVFTDPAAFRYLEEDPSTTILERRRELVGYELYIVEQWACSRIHPTFIITTYTGLAHHTVIVGVLGVPTDENAWSPRLRVYLKAISKFHARKKETPLGTLMVTNLSSFPSALTVVAVPGGDVRNHRMDFIVNEDLKRMGCSGRAGLSLAKPSGATQAKFNQLYRVSDRVPIATAVTELVKLCQVALFLFTKLAPEYADGLLCDVTERAINDWWTEVGAEYFNVEPSDGILGPTTVAALLGMLLGARNRLNAYGATMAKDVFDLKATKRGIAYFQKSQKLPKTRRLDRQTLHRLHKVTSKAANSEGWAVPRAVKSTVAELSGKGGEMVMGIVGARDKAGIAEVETLDIATFIGAIHGESCKWLWQGKPRKNHGGDLSGSLMADEEMVFSGDENAGYTWASRKRDSLTDHGPVSHLDHLYKHPSQGSQTSLDPSDREQALRKTMLKSVTGRMSDARSGLGRFKDAVGLPGLRGHHHRYSKDGNLDIGHDYAKGRPVPPPSDQRDSYSAPQSPRFDQSSSNVEPGQAETKEFVDTSFVDSRNINNTAVSKLISDIQLVDSPVILGKSPDSARRSVANSLNIESEAVPSLPISGQMQARTDSATSRYDKPTTPKITEKDILSMSCYSRSMYQLPAENNCGGMGSKLPRHLSFSAVDDAIFFNEDDSLSDTESQEGYSLQNALAIEHYKGIKTKEIVTQLRHLEGQAMVWLRQKVQEIEDLESRASRDSEDLDAMYDQKSQEHVGLRQATADLLVEEKGSITEAIREIETLGAKLEYELSALYSKVEDVDDAVAEYERQINDLEGRAKELEDDEVTAEPWLWRVVNFVTGIK